MGVLSQNLFWQTEKDSYLNKLITKSEDFVVDQIVNLLSKSSKNNLITLTHIMENIARRESAKTLSRQLRWLFQTNHPHTAWWQKIMSETHPNYRKKLLVDIIMRGFFSDNAKKRKALSEEIGFYPPSVMLTSITQRCNYNCVGCWAHNYDGKDDLTYEEWRKVFTEARDEIGIHIYPIVGGEPFIRNDFLDLTEEFSDCAFMTYTNGSLIDDKKIERMQKTGNVYPMFSLNGFEKTNDALRGKGSFDVVMKKMDELRDAGIIFGASMTATRLNADEVASDEFLQMLSEKGAICSWTFQYVPVGADPDSSLLITPEQREKIRLANTNARNTLPIFTVDFWGDSPMVFGCIAGGKQYFHINGKGDVEPCAFVHLATHNVKKDTIKDALNSPFMTAIREGIPYDGNMLRPCMIIDRPEILRHLYETYKPYQTHDGATDYLVKENIKEQIDCYADRTKKVLDEKWINNMFMTAFPLEGEYYHDRHTLCSTEVPAGGKHGGCEKAGGCKCFKQNPKDLRTYINNISEELKNINNEEKTCQL